MRVRITNSNSVYNGKTGEGTKTVTGKYSVRFPNGSSYLYRPDEIELLDEPVKDETLPRPTPQPVRSIWGKFLFVISLGFWKGN